MKYPYELFVCAALLLGLLAEAVVKRNRPWAIPAIAVYMTVLGWYFVDPFQSPDDYSFIPPSILGFAYVQVGIFLVVFRWAAVKIADALARQASRQRAVPVPVTPQQLFLGLVGVWLLLFGFGLARMNGNLFGALFPLDGRTSSSMWSRERVDSGATGFIVASCAYIYLLVCSFFGITLVFNRQPALRLANLAMVLLTWPYFLLQGSRNIFLAVSMPLFVTYLLFSRQRAATKAFVTAACGVAMFFVLLVVVQHRSTGFRFLVDPNAKEQVEDWVDRDTMGYQQEGLNMIQELCFTSAFVQSGTTSPEWGMRYVVEALNVVPRALWPGKPEIGADYAKWRGYGSLESGDELYATISTGMIGGGVLNFGIYFGPAGAALLMAGWCALLSRWWTQRASVLRAGLFLAGMGLTFNLGRDITLLVLWPILFGYFFVRLIEFAGPSPARLVARRRAAPAARPVLKGAALLSP